MQASTRWHLHHTHIHAASRGATRRHALSYACRYTECRLRQLSEDLFLRDLDSEIVPFEDNFDGSCQEPSVLPARLPQLLINGSQGIAVGIATKIPPHNLREVAAALIAYISDPSISDDALLELVPGPDFPTGALLLPGPGIAGAYATGRGGMTIRSKAHVEAPGAHSTRSTLVVTELPYQVPKAVVIEEIASMVEKGTLAGISDIQDESDRNGLRITIEVKRGSDPHVVLNNLFKHSRLQTRFNANMVALLDGVPQVMTMRGVLKAFADFRFQVRQQVLAHMPTSDSNPEVTCGVIICRPESQDVVPASWAAPIYHVQR